MLPGAGGDSGSVRAAAGCVRLLRPGHAGKGFEALCPAGVSPCGGRAGGHVSWDGPRGVCCLDVKGGEVEGLQMPI